MSRLFAVVAASLWSITAIAAPCDAIDAAGFEALVAQASDALLLESDLAKYDEIEAELRSRSICLTDRVPLEAWTEFVYVGAMVRHARGEPWKPWSAAVYRLDPEYTRIGHPEVREHVPGPPDETFVVPEGPSGLVYEADGRGKGQTFDLEGPHLLQIHDGETWETAWVQDARLPSAWVLAMEAPTATVPADDGGRPLAISVQDAATAPPPEPDAPTEEVAYVPPPPPPTPTSTNTTRPKGLPRSERGPNGLMAGGVTLTVTGAVMGGVAIALGYGIGADASDTSAITALETTEIVGWTLAAGGLAMAIAGGVQKSKLRKAKAAGFAALPTRDGAAVAVSGRF